jgi:[acyl-carrier-protein] S-malonyltransferase
MHQASIQQPGKMAAILGLEESTIAAICQQASQDQEVVMPANLNSPGQIVISGNANAIDRAIQFANAKGARRCVVLNVSGAFHSPLMASAKPLLQQALNQEEIKPMKFAIYMNVNGLKANSNSIKSNMVEQLVSPVQFERTIRNMVQDGMTHFLEIGPGTVLQGLVKKIVPEVPVISFNELTEFDIMKGWLHQHGFIQ